MGVYEMTKAHKSYRGYKLIWSGYKRADDAFIRWGIWIALKDGRGWQTVATVSEELFQKSPEAAAQTKEWALGNLRQLIVTEGRVPWARPSML